MSMGPPITIDRKLAEELRALRGKIRALRLAPADTAPPAILPSPVAEVPRPVPAEERPSLPLLPSMLDDGPFGMALLGTSLGFLQVNAALCSLLGCQHGALLRLGLRDVIHAEDLPACLEAIERLHRESLPRFQWEGRALRQSGGMVRVRLTMRAAPRTGPQGAETLAFIEDITARMEQEAPHPPPAGLPEMLENARDLVFGSDLDGALTFLNKAGERITGHKFDHLKPLTLWQLIVPEQHEELRRLLERCREGTGVPAQDLSVVTKDGQRLNLEASLWLSCRGSEPAAIWGIARSIPDRLRNGDAAQQTRMRLESWVEELDERIREITLLSELAEHLRHCSTIEEGFNHIQEIAERLFPAQVGAIYTLASSGAHLEVAAAWGNQYALERTFGVQECWALRRQRFYLVPDSSRNVLCKHLHWPLPASYLCVPIMARNELLGLFHYSPPENTRLTEAKRRLAIALVDHIALGISNLRHMETMGLESIRDRLTGLSNESFFLESLDRELRRASRSQAHLAIIMLEIDRFSSLTSEHGSEAADACLREMGNLVQTVIRKEDYASRLQDGRFGLLLPQGSAEVAQQRAESLRQLTRDLVINLRGHVLSHLAISAGVSVFPNHGRTREDLLKAAEQVLSRSKNDGGDRVTIATP